MISYEIPILSDAINGDTRDAGCLMLQPSAHKLRLQSIIMQIHKIITVVAIFLHIAMTLTSRKIVRRRTKAAIEQNKKAEAAVKRRMGKMAGNRERKNKSRELMVRLQAILRYVDVKSFKIPYPHITYSTKWVYQQG